MKVLFLGAGASKKAGYPLAGELMAELERECGSTSHSLVRMAWDNFCRFRDETAEPAKSLLMSPNPEIALSLLDLYSLTRSFNETDWFRRIGASSSTEEPAALSGDPYASSPPELGEAQMAIRNLLVCLESFFGRRHFLDSESAATSKRLYLSKELSRLEASDVVITTNWDSLVERVLLEQGRWTPADGFGFPIHLERGGLQKEGPPEFIKSSEVRVLKLHGSFGWYRRDSSRQLYLGFARYLQHMWVDLSGPLMLRDASEPKIPDPSDRPAVIYPTFLKRFDYPELQGVWSSAYEALLEANEISVAGYSLPESDTPVRVLLTSIRARLEKKEVIVTVDDPSAEVRKRWSAFLPNLPKENIRDRRFGEE